MTEGHPLFSVVHHHVQATLGQPYTPTADFQPAYGETQLHRRKSLPHLTQHLGVRQGHVFEHELPGRMTADHWDLALQDQAGGPLIYQESGNATPGALLFVRQRHNDDKVSKVSA